MPILSIQQGWTGVQGVPIRICFIDTSDTIAQVTATGYLNASSALGFTFSSKDLCAVSTLSSVGADPTVGWFEVAKVGVNTSLVSTAQPGSVVLPTVANNIAKFNNTTGGLSDAGYQFKAATTATYAGGGTSNAFTATGLTSAWIATATILTSTNSVAVTKAVAGTNTLTITFSADPGAGTTVQWHAVSAAV